MDIHIFDHRDNHVMTMTWPWKPDELVNPLAALGIQSRRDEDGDASDDRREETIIVAEMIACSQKYQRLGREAAITDVKMCNDISRLTLTLFCPPRFHELVRYVNDGYHGQLGIPECPDGEIKTAWVKD
jgi:hypothetical protein